MARRPPEALIAMRPPMSNSPAVSAAARPAGRAEAHRIDVEELLDGEGVVELDHVEVSCGDACVGEGLDRRLAGKGGVEVVAVVDGLG
jgi:hypothetical protein